MSINERLKELRTAIGASQTEFAEKLGYGRGVIKNLEEERTEPKAVFIEHLCEVYNVNKEWLTAGTGEMFLDTTREEKIAAFVGEALADESDPFKANLISILAGLDENGWNALKNAAETLMKATKKEDG